LHNQQLEEQRQQQEKARLQKQLDAEKRKETEKAPWTPKEGTILIKAFKIYPGGSLDRWQKIADYVNEHGGAENESPEEKEKRKRTADECIKMSKHMQSAAAAEREQFQSVQKRTVKENGAGDDPTVRMDDGAPPPSTANASGTSEWTPKQQQDLEIALKKYPASMFTQNPAERWDKVSEKVTGKSKKEVKMRVKELADMVKRKKAGK
jgi:DnaJ family protein C protein 2